MDKLRVVSQNGDVGWMRRDGRHVSFSDEDTQKLFEFQQFALDATDSDTFDAFAQGWSNGYLTVKA